MVPSVTRRPRAACLALALLAGCAETAGSIDSVRFAPVVQPRGVARANADLAEDFLDLTFQLESGERLGGLLRYEMPVRVHVRSVALEPYSRDLDALLARLRDEAAIDIARTDDPAEAQIHIEAVPAADLRRVFPTAACFIVPGETNWEDFTRRPERRRLRWSRQSTLERAAIFLPVDTNPQDVRDCLHEEMTQALGPANDLYRLPDSVWNDDNFHSIATSFDMLMLRLLYQPELASGMSRGTVGAVLPRLLARENPRGRLPRGPRHVESRPWASAIEVALSRSARVPERRGAAQVAVELAEGMRPRDHRLAVALLTLGRLNLRQNPAASTREFAEAYNLSRALLGPDDIRTAQAAIHVAAIALAAGEYSAAIALAEAHVQAALAAQNAILVAGFLSIEAEALAAQDRIEEAQAARLDSLRWARYGFGDTDGVLAREQAELVALLRLEEG